MLLRGWMLLGSPYAQWTQGSWVIDGGVLREVMPDEAKDSPDLVGYFTPGFVDVHAHVGIDESGVVEEAGRLEQITTDLRTGILTVRDCGSPVDNSELIGREGLPTLIRCGQHIARAKRYIRGLPREVEPADLPIAMGQEAARSSGWVKIIGDWIDRSNGADSDLEPLWPKESLIDGVAAAHEAGARVVVHCFSHKAIDDLLEAGVDDIEHGSGMDADQLAEATARGVFVTPTMRQIELFSEFADQAGQKYPVYAATMRAMYERRIEQAQLIFESGVQVLPGTDAGGYHPHGVLGKELRAWESIGVDRGRILDIATWQAQRAMGQSALDIGTVANLLHFDTDPRDDSSQWDQPKTVLINGQVVYER